MLLLIRITIGRNLFVQGNTVQIDVQTMVVEDNIIVVGSNNDADAVDLGFAAKYKYEGADAYAGIFVWLTRSFIY